MTSSVQKLTIAFYFLDYIRKILKMATLDQYEVDKKKDNHLGKQITIRCQFNLYRKANKMQILLLLFNSG